MTSNEIRIILAREIMSQVDKLGSVVAHHGYADGVWEIKVEKDHITLGGYAAETMTYQLEAVGLKAILKAEYDQESKFSNPKAVLEYFSMTQLAELFEAGEMSLKKKHKPM